MADYNDILAVIVDRLQKGESMSDIVKSMQSDSTEVLLPDLGGREDMDKKSAMAGSRLERLDLKGVGPDMLAAIANRDVQTVMQQPIILQRTGERLERIRRLKDELKSPGSHLKPEKPKNPAAAAAADLMPGSPHMPAGPGGPVAPSNLLGGFGPEQMAQSQALMSQMPKMGRAKRKRDKSNVLLDQLYGDGVPKEKLKELGERYSEARKGKNAKDDRLRKMAYKYGFFMKVAELGLTPKEFEKKAVLGPLLTWLGLKSAEGAKDAVGGTAQTIKDLIASGLWIPMLAAPTVGAGLGAAYRYTTAPGYSTPDEFKHVERLAELKRETRAARRRARKQRRG